MERLQPSPRRQPRCEGRSEIVSARSSLQHTHAPVVHVVLLYPLIVFFGALASHFLKKPGDVTLPGWYPLIVAPIKSGWRSGV